MAHVLDVTVMSGNRRPMSEGLALGQVGSLGGKKTHGFADSNVVSGGSDDLRIMVRLLPTIFLTHHQFSNGTNSLGSVQ